MAAKCDYAGKEIVKKDYGVNKEMGNKCENVNKIKAVKYEYVAKKFGFSRVLWVIKNYCITPPLECKTKTFCSPEFYVRGHRLTRWEMILERVWNPAEKKYNVFFFLKRLMCQKYIGHAVADCFLEYSDHEGHTCEIYFNYTFRDTMNISEKIQARDAGITPTVKYHTPEFKLKLEMLVYFNDLNETTPLCENLGIRRLSEDLKNLYDNGVVPDLSLHLQSNRQLNLHKAIFYTRITNLNFKNDIASSTGAIDLQDFVSKDMEKVIRFLYTGNLIYTVDSEPSIGAYKIAEWLEIKPIIAYYNPDEITFTSDTDVEEFSDTWTIEDFSSRDDYLLQSPVMTNKMMDTKWQIQVFPKGFQNERVYLDVFFVYEIKVSKTICVELFLQSKPDEPEGPEKPDESEGPEKLEPEGPEKPDDPEGPENPDDPEGPEEPKGFISYRVHKKINCKGRLKANFIKLDELANNDIRHLTIGLRLRISTGQDNHSVCSESKANYKYLSAQKYYHQLSNDILRLSENVQLSNLRRSLENHNITLNVHECILRALCESLSNALLNNLDSFNNIRKPVIFEILYFVYSGKLYDSNIEETFDLYRAAEHFNYQHLKDIIAEKLKTLLSDLNAMIILEFALVQGIQNLVDSAQSLLR